MHSASSHTVQLRKIKRFRENCAAMHIPQSDNPGAAPNLLHRPVNSLQSVEKSQVTASGFSLTPETKRVKTQSFFDSF
jgi:hypothetical protein